MEENGGSLWLPEAISTLAPEVDSLFYFVTWVSTIIFAAVLAAMVYFIIRYRRQHPNERPAPVYQSHVLEAAWIVIPTILVLVVFTWGFKLFVRLQVAPPDAYEIQVRAKQWAWEFEYPNGTTSFAELRVPVDRPVRLVMMSEDVLHSFFVPVFRVKQDVLPNRYTSVWFEATKTGEFPIMCTEYCGTAHSNMYGTVMVLPEAEFREYVETGGGDLPPVEMGERLYTQLTCNACHSIDGTRVVGPTFKGLYNANRPLADGTSVVADENYLRTAIVAPMEEIVEGYPAAMPTTYSTLNDDQLTALIEYIKTLE